MILYGFQLSLSDQYANVRGDMVQGSPLRIQICDFNSRLGVIVITNWIVNIRTFLNQPIHKLDLLYHIRDMVRVMIRSAF